ncbi:MAG: hypothetical protein Q9172_003081 [Xanthocarpia lactea]
MPPSDPPVIQQPTRSEPPGARFDGQTFEMHGVPFLFPLDRAVFHLLYDGSTAGNPDGMIQPFIYFTRLTVTDLFNSLGVKKGITEVRETGDGKWVKSQTILVGDAQAERKLEEIGWSAGRGISSKPVWLQVL